MNKEPLKELTCDDIQNEVTAAYPGLATFLTQATASLYNALWFGLQTKSMLGFESATATYMRSKDYRPGVATDVGRLDVLTGLVMFAEHDASFEALISGAGYELKDLAAAPRRPHCQGILKIDCRCLIQENEDVTD